MMLYRVVLTGVVFLLMTTGLLAQKNILLIPMDDRASSCQFPERLGDIGNVNIVIPPKEILGQFMVPGNSEKIIDWIKTQKLEQFDAAIISLDMLAYGGLVASREYWIGAEDAQERLHVVEYIRSQAPQIKIYAHSIIMRLALTFQAKNEAYYMKFLNWATWAGENSQEARDKVASLAKDIPPVVMENYLAARSRNLKGNLLAVELVDRGIIDYLVLSQDDASPTGLHIPDRNQILSKIAPDNLGSKIRVQAGADEISMLLAARCIQELKGQEVKIKVSYYAEGKQDEIMPFEDHPLNGTVLSHIETSGALQIEDENEADLLLYIFASRQDDKLMPVFVDAVEHKVKAGFKVIVADIDDTGRIQGAYTTLTKELLNRGLFPKLYGYASWNTAANTLGTALPQGIIYCGSKNDAKLWKEKGEQIQRAQDWFTIHRLLDDYLYHTLIRSQYKAMIPLKSGWSEDLTRTGRKKAEDYAMRVFNEQLSSLISNYTSNSPNPTKRYVIQNLGIDLHWNRAFEAMIDFDLATL